MASTVDSADVYLSDVDNSLECHVCSASGHMRASVSSGQDKWIVDSGATHHTTPDASKVVNGTDYNGPGKSDESLLKAGQQGSSCKHELSVVRGAHKVCTDFVMSPTTTSFTMNGRDQYEGQLSAGGQNNEGRQEDVANIGGINVEIQPDATEEDPVDYVDPEIPCAESGVEVTVEHDVQSGDESICGDGLLSGGGDEAIADVPEISVTNLPIMSMTGENSDDLMKLSSSDESPKEPEEVAETPTNAKNKRKGKKVVEATSGRDGLKDVDVSVVRVCAAVKYVRKAFKNLKTKYLPYTKELRKIGGAPDDEDWDKIASFLPFLQMFYEATLSFSGSRNKLRYVEWIIRRSYDPSDSYDLCHRIKSTLASLFDFYASSHPSSTQTRLVEALVCTQDWIRASHDPIMIEESLLALENMEEEMQDLTLEQPTIIIDETSEVPELFL
ncbi:hypothetical protein V6N11_035013 [Hibiscus sabdariffa]|uniref:HAT C-terminal dimerisation domain-containing protein n=1 Tax=Hibiscus sabdariffa TaxID=183260 RepID=A0ABR2QZ94_9ROSI